LQEHIFDKGGSVLKLSKGFLPIIQIVLVTLFFINLNSKSVLAAEKSGSGGLGFGMGMIGKITMPAMGGYCLFGGCVKGDEAFLLGKLDQIFIANYNSLSAFKANLEGLSNEYQVDIKAPFSEEQKKLVGETLYTAGVQEKGKKLDLLVSDIPENAYEYLYAKYLNNLDGQLASADMIKEMSDDKWSDEANRKIQRTKDIIKYLESKIQKGKLISSCESGHLEDYKYVDGKCHTRTVEDWGFEYQEKERQLAQDVVPVEVTAYENVVSEIPGSLDLSRESDKLQCFDELIQFLKSNREITRPTNMITDVADLKNVYNINADNAAVEFAILNNFGKCSIVNFRIYTEKGRKYLYIDQLNLNHKVLNSREFKEYWAEVVRKPSQTKMSKMAGSTRVIFSKPRIDGNR
jgi:hypothetical protein